MNMVQIKLFAQKTSGSIPAELEEKVNAYLQEHKESIEVVDIKYNFSPLDPEGGTGKHHSVMVIYKTKDA